MVEHFVASRMCLEATIEFFGERKQACLIQGQKTQFPRKMLLEGKNAYSLPGLHASEQKDSISNVVGTDISQTLLIFRVFSMAIDEPREIIDSVGQVFHRNLLPFAWQTRISGRQAKQLVTVAIREVIYDAAQQPFLHISSSVISRRCYQTRTTWNSRRNKQCAREAFNFSGRLAVMHMSPQTVTTETLRLLLARMAVCKYI